MSQEGFPVLPGLCCRLGIGCALVSQGLDGSPLRGTQVSWAQGKSGGTGRLPALEGSVP